MFWFKCIGIPKKLLKRMFNPNRPQTFAVTPKNITTRLGYKGEKSQFLPLEAAKRRLVTYKIAHLERITRAIA